MRTGILRLVLAAMATALGASCRPKAEPSVESSQRRESQSLERTAVLPQASSDVVVNEVQYLPPGGDPRGEWIELYNRGPEAVDVGGWRFVEGVLFAFPEGTRIGAAAYLVVCADAEHIRATMGVDSALGNWTDSLDDGGETIRLLDADGGEVESVVYDDGHPFPPLAAGLESSLERRNPDVSSALAANWGASVPAGWSRVRTTGEATSSTLYLYLGVPGTAYVDDLSIRSLSGGREAVMCADFDGSTPSLTSRGTHRGSSLSAESARSGRRSLKIAATGSGASRGNAVVIQGLGLDRGRRYELSLWASFPHGGVPLIARLSGSREGEGVFVQAVAAGATPGAKNSLYSEFLPPLVEALGHVPPVPAPGEEVVISARVFAPSPLTAVNLHLDGERGERTIALHDDGAPAHGDARAGDGTYSARVGPFRGGSLVRYRVAVQDIHGNLGRFPIGGGLTRHLGLYVADPEERSPFPIYHLILDRAELRELERNPFSDAYRRGTFVYNGEVYCDARIRFRGQTSRFLPKHHWKVKFNRDRPFRAPKPGHPPLTTVNLQSCFGDKIFLREVLGYNLFRDLGEAYCETWHVRVYLNGSYLGFFVHLENPGGTFLARNGLGEGWLWKSYSGARSRSVSGFEIEAGDPETGNALLSGFLRGLHARSGDALESYIREHMNVDSFVNYLAACQLIHNADHVEKNYLVYADPEGRFTFLPWDLDLTHGRNFECGGGGVWNNTIRHDMWDTQSGDDALLFGTRVHRKCDGYHNGVIDAFLRKTSAFRPLYYRRLSEHLSHYYHPRVLIPKVERWRGRIRDEVRRDRRRWGTYGGDSDFDRRFDLFVRWIRDRYEHLEEKLTALGYAPGEPLNAWFECEPSHGPAPLKVTFRDLSAGDITEYEWSFGDGASSADREPTHVYRESGLYDVELRVRGPAGVHAGLRRASILVAD